MKVLFVAPQTTLFFAADEAQRVIDSALDTTPMLGTVTALMLFDKLRAGNYAALWLATHGTADGVLLSDGPLPAARLAQFAAGRLGLIILNTCNSIEAAQLLQAETDCEIVATIREVPDLEAFYTGVLLADALAATEDVAAAVKLARLGGNRTYVHLAGLKKT